LESRSLNLCLFGSHVGHRLWGDCVSLSLWVGGWVHVVHSRQASQPCRRCRMSLLVLARSPNKKAGVSDGPTCVVNTQPNQTRAHFASASSPRSHLVSCPPRSLCAAKTRPAKRFALRVTHVSFVPTSCSRCDDTHRVGVSCVGCDFIQVELEAVEEVQRGSCPSSTRAHTQRPSTRKRCALQLRQHSTSCASSTR
jgi:hypothetical protein